ncbi:MAG TPA: cyclic pyranopterin monophosphate synthase MoaC [Bacteroidales bacterium]|nr:cyclic pyranopterin monophosphate synthase MoaC [Bacteroidales bacterium]
MENHFSHIDQDGKAKMVNVGDKDVVHRKALAEGIIFLQPTTLEKIKQFEIKKGDVLTVAQIAGIQAAKQTAHLIPLCHPLQLNHIEVNFEILDNGIKAISRTECDGKTGVEMEALTAVSVALLAIYDMCKAVDKTMVLSEIKLLNKTKTAIEK